MAEHWTPNSMDGGSNPSRRANKENKIMKLEKELRILIEQWRIVADENESSNDRFENGIELGYKLASDDLEYLLEERENETEID